MISESSPCLLGQHGSCSTAQRPVELSENILQNLFNKLLPQTVGLVERKVLTDCDRKEAPTLLQTATGVIRQLHFGRRSRASALIWRWIPANPIPHHQIGKCHSDIFE